jgi:hypothetical protein
MTHESTLNQLMSRVQSVGVQGREKPVKAPLGVLLDCNVFVSKKGLQFGADAGNA